MRLSALQLTRPPILPPILALALAWAMPGSTAAARALRKPLFGPAVAWPRTQNKRSVAVAKRFCHGLSTRPAPLSRADRALPTVPEHRGLRWGLPVAKVRWALARSRQPVRLHCFAKTANAYLTQRRRLSKAVRGVPRALWSVTFYFRTRAPYGLFDILLSSARMTLHQAKAVLKAARARYGPAQAKPGHRDARTRSTRYVWIRGKTRIRLILTRLLPSNRARVSIRYSGG